MLLNPKSRMISLFLIALTLHDANSVDIQCEFKFDDFDSISNQYTCIVQVNLMIMTKNVEIQSIHGTHKSGKSNSDVNGLSIRDKRILYMPTNLVDKFKNLIAMRIRQGKLKEVSQNDFKPFPNLRYLNLDANDLEVLDNDLFEFNLLLEVIWFEGNRIKSIGQSTFDNLKNLRDLDMNSNICFSKRMSSKFEVSSNMAAIKQKCYNPDVELTKLKIKFKESKKEILNFSLKVDELNIQINEKDTKIESLTGSVNNLTTSINKAQETINQLNRQLERQQLKLNHTDSLLKQSILINNDVIEKLAVLEAKYATTINNTAINEEMMNKHINVLEQQFNDKELELQSLNQSCMTQLTQKDKFYKHQMELLQQSLGNKDTDLQSLTQKLLNFEQSMNNTELHLKDLQIQLQNHRQTEIHLKQNISELEMQLDMRQIDFENMTDIIANNSLKLLNYEQELIELRQQVNETETKYAVSDSQLLQVSTNLKNISAANINLELNLRNLKEQLKRSEEELKNLETLNAELSDELINQTQIAEAIHQGDNINLTGGMSLIIGTAIMILLTIVNVCIVMRYYRKRGTIVLREIQADENDSM